MASHNESSGDVAGTLVQIGQLVQQQPAPAPVRPWWGIQRQLQGRFVNQDRAFAETRALLTGVEESGNPGVLHVIGPPGIGKTAFGEELAATRRTEFSDALYVDLAEERAAGGLNLADVLARFLGELGVPEEEIPAGLDALVRRFRHVTTDRRVIIMVEGVLRRGEAVTFRPGPGRSLLVVTSRREIPALVRDGVRRLRLSALRSDDALDVLRDFDRLPDLVARDPEAARSLVDCCGGLPLALRIMGAHLAMHQDATLDEVVAELRESPSTIEALDRVTEDEEDEDRPRVAEVFEVGFRGLGSSAAWLYRRLGAYPGRTFHRGLAVAVTGDPAVASAALEELVRACLVRRGDGGAHHWEPLVHDDARRRAADLPPPDREAARRAILRWHVSTAERMDTLMLAGRRRAADDLGERSGDAAGEPYEAPFGESAEEAAEWADGRTGILGELLRMAADLEAYDAVVRLAEAYWPLVHSRKRLIAGAAAYDRAIRAAQALGHRGVEARMRNYRARIHVEMGEYEAAHAQLRLALDAAVDSGAAVNRAAVFETFGLMRRGLGDLEGAVRDVKSGRDIHHDLGNARGVALYAYQLGGLRWQLGDLAGSRDELAEAERVVRAELDALRESGDGDHDSAVERLRHDWAVLEAKIATRIARTLLGLGDLSGALTRARAAWEFMRADGQPVQEADALTVIGEIASHDAQPETARTCLTQAMALYHAHHLDDRAARVQRLRDGLDA